MPKRIKDVHVQSAVEDGVPSVLVAIGGVDDWAHESLTPDEAEIVAAALCHSAAIARHAAAYAPRPRYGYERALRDTLEKVKAAVALRPPRKRGYRQ